MSKTRKSKIDKQIEFHYNEAYQIAFKWLKNHLLYMYENNEKKLSCILNCMGTTAFYHKNGESMWSHEERKLIGYNTLNNFLMEWNDIFHLTGDPIKIDENGIDPNY